MGENSPNVQVMEMHACNALLPKANACILQAKLCSASGFSVNGLNIVLMNIHDAPDVLFAAGQLLCVRYEEK